MKLKEWVELAPGEVYDGIEGPAEVEVSVPAKYDVCGRCQGNGSQDVFDNGVPSRYFDEDPDFAEDYRSGVYSKPCEKCDGLRVVQVPDRDVADKKALELYERGEEARLQVEYEEQAERRFFQRAAEGMARW